MQDIEFLPIFPNSFWLIVKADKDICTYFLSTGLQRASRLLVMQRFSKWRHPPGKNPKTSRSRLDISELKCHLSPVFGLVFQFKGDIMCDVIVRSSCKELTEIHLIFLNPFSHLNWFNLVASHGACHSFQFKTVMLCQYIRSFLISQRK